VLSSPFSSMQVMKLLQKTGVENIDTVTLMADCNNPSYNSGYAFIDLGRIEMHWRHTESFQSQVFLADV
jgi:hypothetical protein